jgi:ElaB/YqjD/DUF883 family membrane-anchored ribosome-binding protein
MAQDNVEHMAGAVEAQTRSAVRTAQDVAERAGSYVQQQVTQLSDRAQDLARDANDRLKEYTGRPLDAWVAETRSFVRAHPLQVLAGTIAVGYILGKIVRR